MITKEELQIRLKWSLDMKIQHFVNVFYQFMEQVEGEAYLSFSGGKDSQVGADIIDKLYNGTFKHFLPEHRYNKLLNYPKPPRVFANTGLEYPEIVEHARSFDNTIFLKPKMGFTRVIKEYGVALISKEVAQKIREIRNTKSEKLKNKRLFGQGGSGRLPLKWRKLINAPFKISEQCCFIFKKEPFQRFEKETGLNPVVFTTVGESGLRYTSYLKTGCNTFSEDKSKCRPFSIFNESDVWAYHDKYALKFASVYYDREVDVKQLDGTVKRESLKGVDRTGCTFCLFGIHLEDKSKLNRIQKLAISHPKYWDIVINKVGLNTVLDYINVPYSPTVGCKKQFDMFEGFLPPKG